MSVLAMTILRATAAFFLILLVVRFIGRKIISRLTIFDFIAAIAVGSMTATMAVNHRVSPWAVAAALIVWAVLTFSLDFILLKSLPLRKIIEGEPVIVIQNGKLLEKNMRRIRLNMDELMQQLRVKNLFDPSQVEFAVLEPDGRLSVLPKTQHQPVTAHTLGVSTPYQGMVSALVKDGRILDQNLSQNYLNREWLHSTLAKRGIDDVADVFYAALDTQGNLFVDLRDDDLAYVQEVEDVPRDRDTLLS